MCLWKDLTSLGIIDTRGLGLKLTPFPVKAGIQNWQLINSVLGSGLREMAKFERMTRNVCLN